MIITEKIFSIAKGEDIEAALDKFRQALKDMPDDIISVTLEVSGDIAVLKKRYFAMVKELGEYAGYLDHKEREIFKKQVKQQLNIKSIAEVKERSEIVTVIESLHKLAGEHYNYTFKLKNGTVSFISFDDTERDQ